ncbi:MAG: hypothetical protein JRN52_09375 [Nitrososphaerota archaeon]|nr:hypothetical protein [Nitrososphaerota archaeon]
MSVVPDVSAVGKNVTVIVTALGKGYEDSKMINFTVAQGEDSRGEYARQIRDMFVQWLETNHPELGIQIKLNGRERLLVPFGLSCRITCFSQTTGKCTSTDM